MTTPYLSEIKIMSFGFAPKGWALCNGQLLPINQNQALFSLLGTTYGGDGRINFGLPDLRSRIPIHMGNSHTLGERGGEEAHTLNISELAAHNHFVTASDTAPGGGTGGHTPAPGKLLARSAAVTSSGTVDVQLYVASNTTAAAFANSINPIGGSQPHLNQQPFLVLNFCIALQGIFPSQN